MITSCYNLTLDKFISCIVDNNYSVLGKGSKLEQYTAWSEIFNEYSQLVKDDTTMYIFELQKDVYVLKTKLKILETCVDILWKKYSREITIELNKLGFNTVLDWSNKKEYYKQLKLTLSRGNSWKLEINRKEKEIKSILEKNKGEGYTRQYFTKINANLNKYMNFYIDVKKVMVADWCEWLNNYTEQIEAINKRSTTSITYASQ